MAGFHLKIAFTTIALIFSASVSYGSTCKAITVELIPSCSNETICKWMGYVESGTNLGDKLSYALNTQARQRGLNCAREESFGKPSTPLRDAFVGFTKEKRTTIQSKLAAIELYTSTIDGLWGKGTETALQRYNSKYLSNLDLSKVDNLRFLYHKILTKDLVDEPDLSIEKTNSVGAECADDPNECTLKKLCEVATALDGGNRIWSTEASSAKHVNTAQILGMECGITSIVDPCDTDPSECKLSQICGKATTESSGQVSWDDSAAAYVALAKEYGLGCDVNDEAEEAPEAIKLRFAKLQNEALATISRDVLTIKLAVIIGVVVWLATTLGIFSIS